MEEERILVSFTDAMAITYIITSVSHREGWMGMKKLGSLPKLECPTHIPPLQTEFNYENDDVIIMCISAVPSRYKTTRIDLRAATLKNQDYITDNICTLFVNILGDTW